MSEIIAQIELQCRHQQFDVNSLINRFNISDTYLRELSRKIFGLSPSELIESVRLSYILNHIESKEHFVCLSEKCGFGCIKTFNRVFSKRIGISAAQARKQLLLTTDKDALKQEWLHIIWLRGGKGIPLSIQRKKSW
ncbi:MAG: helix-turn-helix domain-containing protein [Bacteroidetes bacterium]|nr:helix-turn-helix domain-containing protein [Bacteroidota bacterium]